MKHYDHILVVIEPKREQQVALQRALELVRYNPKAEITVLRLIYDFSYEMHLVNRLREKETRQEVLALHQKQVDELVSRYRGTAEVVITTKVLFARDIGEGIIEEVNRPDSRYDLLIKAANHHSVLDSLIFTPIDWYLLRNASIPVVIAKDHPWEENRNIVVALDFTFSTRNRTNIVLLREAQLLAAVTGGQVHLVNSAPVVLPTVMLEVPHYAPEIYAESIINEHKRRLLQFAQMHNIPREHCHIAEGMPDDVIPEICRKLNAGVILIGSAGRSGAMATLIGNTCEEIVDYVDADLIVINNRTIGQKRAPA